MAAQTKSKLRPRRPIYLRVRKVIDAETGEHMGALVPLTKWDARAMRDRKMHVNVELRAELKQRRNVRFHRLSHALGAMLVEQVEDFAELSAHDALKRLQRECGVCCDEMAMTIDLGAGIGKVNVPVKVPRSIAFDECDESEFSELMNAIYRHVSKTYWPDMTPEAVEEMVLMYEGNSNG